MSNASANGKQKMTIRIVKRNSAGAGKKSGDETIEQALATALKRHSAQVDELADHIRRLNAMGMTAVKPEQAGMLHIIYAAGGAVDLVFGTVGWEDEDASLGVH